MKRRTAYSLLELLVASAIFAGMILAATATLTTSTTLRDQEQATNEVTNYADGLMSRISRQISYASAVVPGTVDASSAWVAVTVPSLDDYGRVKTSGSAMTAYCTSAAGVFHIISLTALPTSDPCPATETNPNTYSVTMSLTPVIGNAKVSAAKLTIKVVGKVGGVAGGRTGTSAPISYTSASLVQYGNSILPHEIAK